ncbi:MAG TPA: SEFIR domain-containing protein [Terriglobales bacterium]|nr:SEFIR domain-containing protein [Terriglobales bacterium]
MKANPNTLSEIAPTLADLKKLAMEQKCRLLLARLAKIGEHDSALNKHNLMLPGDPYGLAYGYRDAEKGPVREHLLGAPWTKLVNEGYLVDLTGQGFYKVTEEGKEYLADQELPAQSSPASTNPASTKTPMSTTGAPRAFLSYSWEGQEHQQWVTKFAERLRGESGVEIIFDRWHLKPG